MSVDILVLFINCFPELIESLSKNSYISVSFSEFLKMYHVPVIEPHILVSSYVLYLCIRIHILVLITNLCSALVPGDESLDQSKKNDTKKLKQQNLTHAFAFL